MQKKVVLCLVMLLFTASTVTNAGRPKTKKQDKEALYEARHEIDNYDFLYNDSQFDYGYDVTATENLMDEAFAHIGTRYRRGAKGPSAFDCSGFTSYVFGKMNMQIGCSSRDQYAKNTPIRSEEMQRGDLVFFTSPGSGRGVGHVGIIVDVNEDGTFSFIHASTREGVKISKSTEGYYAKRYIGVRRVM
ncbi:MAG: C40 family peptidase [Prevotella sp.]|nr:C40 family peptidase [Prevotella sp.]MBQ9651862.1 C40 family peptidase [Prevotella sp.]